MLGRNKEPKPQPVNPYGISYAPQISQEPGTGEGLLSPENRTTAEQFQKDSGVRATAESVEVIDSEPSGIETDTNPEAELEADFTHHSGELATEQLVAIGNEAKEVIDDRTKMEKLADDCISQAEKIRLVYTGPSGQQFYTEGGQELSGPEMRRPSSKNYGQGSFVDQDNPSRVPEQFRREVKEDGTTRIYYTAFAYRDISGRPGAKLEMDFDLPSDAAQSLEDSIMPGLEDFSEVMEKIIDSSRPQNENWTGPTLWQRIKNSRTGDAKGEQQVIQVVTEEEGIPEDVFEINCN